MSLTAGLSSAATSVPVIGFVTARGMVQLDASPVAGQGTLFEGSTVETGTAGSMLQVPKAASLYLGSSSRAKVFRDHLILEKGDGELSSATQYWVEARGLRIASLDSEAGARISLRGDGQVVVGALRGPVRVGNQQGLLVAWVRQGESLQLEPQSESTPSPSTVTGCLERVSGHYLLTDETTSVKVEVKGTGLDKEVGSKVTVNGVRDQSGQAAASASHRINATTVTHVSKHCVLPGGTAAAAGAVAGVSSKAVVVGVSIVGAAVAGSVLAVRAQDNGKQSISQ